MKRLTISALSLWLAALAVVQAQPFPQPGVISGVVGQATYSASSAQLVPAASGTDIFCINGSTSRNIHIRRFIISGTAGTAITTPILVNYNHSLDSGGTAATGLAAPVAAPFNPTQAASTISAATAYTANPTVNDSTPNLLAVVSPTFAVTTTANSMTTLNFGPGFGPGFDKSLDIPKASTVVAQICLNLDGKSISSGVLNITAEWTED